MFKDNIQQNILWVRFNDNFKGQILVISIMVIYKIIV
jgi:hypothetical protein